MNFDSFENTLEDSIRSESLVIYIEPITACFNSAIYDYQQSSANVDIRSMTSDTDMNSDKGKIKSSVSDTDSDKVKTSDTLSDSETHVR